MSREEVSSTTSSTSTLTIEDIKRAVKMFEEAAKEPYIAYILTKEKLSEVFPKSVDVRTFFFAGIDVYPDKDIPDGILRFVWSDGRTEDVKITNKPRYLPAV